MYGEYKMEYSIVEGLNVRDVIRKVNLKIEEGWKPEGGIALTKEALPQSPNSRFFQAIIKETKK